MKKRKVKSKMRINKIAIGVFIMFVPMLWNPEQLSASTAWRSVEIQQKDEKKVTLNITDRNLTYILSEIKKQTGLAYGFKDNRNMANQDQRFTINVRNVSVDSALTVLLKDSRYTYSIKGDLILIMTKEEKKQAADKKEMITLKGRITDEKGYPVAGATIVVHGTTRGVASDADGRYSIDVNPDDALKVTFIGYKDDMVLVKGKTTLNIRLEPTVESLEEVAVVAFGEQKKESVVSSITTVRPMDLKSSNSDLTTSFAGKIAGIVGWQTGGLPGALTEDEMNTKFYVRGITSFQTEANVDPLILLDGVEISKVDLARIAPEDIESFSVMKDASATAMYGARGANGVILVTTKKGEAGSVYASVRYEAIASMPTKEIDVVDPITYMRMYNRALLSRDPSATPAYSEERIARTNNPRYPSYAYPANDWYDILFKDYNVNHHLGLNIRGGSNVMQYYASVNYNIDQGMLKTDRLNDFDCNIKNSTLGLRVNLNIDLAAGIRLLVNSNTVLDKNHGPLMDQTAAYQYAFNVSPVDFAAVYPADDVYYWDHVRFGTTTGRKVNPYMELHRGYKDRNRYSFINKVEYIHNLSSLIKGLELRASMSYTKVGLEMTALKTEPYQYILDSYDELTNTFKLQCINEDQANTALSMNTTSESSDVQTTYEVRALHTAAWDEHQTSLTAVFNAQESRHTPATKLFNTFPSRNLGFSMRGTYGFKDRYFAEASFGYNGSERFSKKHKMGFFPAVGAAWIVSKENFMQSVSNWLPFLKLRFSWGKVGNDGIIKEPRFVYLEEINLIQQQGFSLKPGETSGKFYVINNYGNQDIKWEVAEQSNLGLETKLFDGIVEFTLDAYQEIRHNILSFRTVVPEAIGFDALQQDNIGKVRSRGIDFSGKIQHAFSSDFWVILNGTFTYNKATCMEIEEATDKPEWQRKVGHEISQKIGYIAEGLFRDQAEIDNAPDQGGDVMPGDIRYRDVNGDGKISIEDAMYIGFPTTPRVTYGFSGYVNYKNWEFNFSFQGSGKRGFFIDAGKISPFVGDHAMLTEIYKSHWSEDNMDNRPFWPRLSTQSIIHHNPQEGSEVSTTEDQRSTYFMRECSFLRCTALELAYNLPDNLKKKLKMKNVKFFVRANNPFLISNFKVWDVELGEHGFNYPIQKTYSVGLNFSF